MDSLLVRLRHALELRYSVEHELGRGGMACIFLGRDLRLDRRVAIKVFEREPSLASATERFLREIRIAAQLQHPNILPVFESGEAEGLVYYVMPYVGGGSLRERLEREGPLPIADAVRVAREVAEALDHAHRAGIVHRDIKPDNIMLADGAAVVADFGIARAIEQGSTKVTDTGLAIGTPTYMSPEQGSASSQLDGRTDTYSLGCVLYEMLAGSPPFHGATAQLVMARHATDRVPPLNTVRRVPDALDAVVQKALAKVPGDRWPSGRAFADALAGSVPSTSTEPRATKRLARRWLGLAAAAVLAIVVAAMWGNRSAGAGDTQPSAASDVDSLPSVGVLPFRMTGDSSYAHVAAGMTDAVITAFIRVGGISVPGQSTVSRYATQGRDAVAIGRELGVANVLDGSVQVNGARLRVTARMIRVRDGRSLWVTSLDGEMTDIFAMQDTISRSIIDTLRIRLTPASQSALITAVGTHNEGAYQDYMLGRAMYSRADAQSLRRAVQYFEAAAKRDSLYAAPVVGILESYMLLENVEPSADQVSSSTLSAMQRRALQLDPSNGALRAILAERSWRACDTASAEREWGEAIRLNPGSAEVRRNYSIFLIGLGRADSALRVAKAAAALDRTSPWVQSQLAYSYSSIGQLDSALSVSGRFLGLDTTQWVPNAVRGVAEVLAGQLTEGIRHLETAGRLGGGNHGLTTAYLGWGYARAGRREKALDVARLLETRVNRGDATRLHVASVYAGLNDYEKAFEWMAKPPRASDWKATGAGPWEPTLRPLQADPRFKPLASRQACIAG